MDSTKHVSAETARIWVTHPNGMRGYLMTPWGKSVTVRFENNTILRLQTATAPPGQASKS